MENAEEQVVVLRSEILYLKEQVIKYREESKRFSEEAIQNRQFLKKNEVQTTEMIAFLRNELLKKDVEINTYKNSVLSVKGECNEAAEKIKKELETKNQELASTLETHKEESRKKIDELEEELFHLQYYRKNKKELEGTLLAAKKTIEKQAEEFQRTVERLEAKCIEEVSEERERGEQALARLRKRAMEEATKILDAESKALRKQNRELLTHLTSHSKSSEVMTQENQRLKKELSQCRVDLSLNESVSDEVHRRSTVLKKKNAKLFEKNSDLEHTLGMEIRKSRQEQSQLVLRNAKNNEEMQEELETTQAALQLVKTELAHVRKNAMKVLKQRTECEQFFHEALEQVKSEKVREQERKFRHEKERYRDTLRTFGIKGEPKKKVLGKNTRNSKCRAMVIQKPRTPSKNLTLKDLSLDDRERVLRLLLMKINALEKTRMANVDEYLKELQHQPYDPGTTFLTEQKF